MDTIEKLIKTLQEAKAELEKGLNTAPGVAGMNKGDIIVPDKGYGKITVKDTTPKSSNPNKPFGSVTVKDTTPKPSNPSKPFGSVTVKNEDMEKDAADPKLAPKDVKVKELQGKIDAGTYKPDASKIADKMVKEELSCSANGQWNLKTSLDKKVRESDWSSDHTDPSANPGLGGKYGKVHGGDPRKSFKGPGSGDRVNSDLAIENVDGKMKQRISGASNLRSENITPEAKPKSSK